MLKLKANHTLRNHTELDNFLLLISPRKTSIGGWKKLKATLYPKATE